MKFGSRAYHRYFNVCIKIGVCRPNSRAFFAPNMAKIGQYIVLHLFSCEVSAELTWNLINKLTGAVLRVFQICKSPRGLFWEPFWASEWGKIEVFEYLVKGFLWIHTCLALCVHLSLLQRHVKYGPQRSNFWAILGSKAKFLVYGHFLKKFSLISHKYWFRCSLQAL